ncbi:hypothetical protein KSP39_PZI015276 [Platanthera zijinensis]|uniref:DUF4228 domain-containing protein n=1 Tax=Platanthera zijinensis TaxID=2320716 RepID=A0AAP0B8F8_9ASPA
MGNCQAAEAATVLIQHPGGRLERIYWSLSAGQVMASHPGHYVAVIISSQPPSPNLAAGAEAPVKHLKLLRPVDTLHIGHVYRLVSFEDVLKDFASKKHLRLCKIINASKKKGPTRGSKPGGRDPASSDPSLWGKQEAITGDNLAGEAAAPPSRAGQWRPALQSIAEGVGS